MQQLEAALAAAGFAIHRSCCANPTICASRLAVVRTESLNLDDEHEWRDRIKTCTGTLTRTADGEIATPVKISRARRCVEAVFGSNLGQI